MKNYNYILLSILFIFFAYSCTDEFENNSSVEDSELKVEEIKENDETNLFTNHPLEEFDKIESSDKTLKASTTVLVNKRVYIRKGQYYYYRFSKSYLSNKRAFIKVTEVNGKSYAAAYGKGSTWRRIRYRYTSGTDATYIDKNDLRSYESNGYLMAIPTKSGYFDIKIYVVTNSAVSQYPSSCLQNRYSTCSYARSKNAFYATPNNQDLLGQCTWYTYGRVIELVEKGYLPSNSKNRFYNAFWGTSGRSARYWPNKLGGSWYNTNSSALPVSKRKQGLVAVWVFGNHGHVGFVEEISADKSKYRLSDFNRNENLQRRDQWYSFEGTSDELGGVYPRFLDLNAL